MSSVSGEFLAKFAYFLNIQRNLPHTKREYAGRQLIYQYRTDEPDTLYTFTAYKTNQGKLTRLTPSMEIIYPSNQHMNYTVYNFLAYGIFNKEGFPLYSEVKPLSENDEYYRQGVAYRIHDVDEDILNCIEEITIPKDKVISVDFSLMLERGGDVK